MISRSMALRAGQMFAGFRPTQHGSESPATDRHGLGLRLLRGQPIFLLPCREPTRDFGESHVPLRRADAERRYSSRLWFAEDEVVRLLSRQQGGLG